MKTVIKITNFALMILVAFSACKKEDVPREYTGINDIYLQAEKDPVLTVGDGGAIKVLLKSTQRAIRDTRFEFSITSLQEKDKSVPVEVKQKEVVLKKGERQTEFHIVTKKDAQIDNEGSDTDVKQYEIEITQMPDKQMKLKEKLRIRLLNVTIPTLTEKQLKLIEGYKSKGMDIEPFLGKTQVKTTVKIPAGGLIEGFKDPATKVYQGFSVITLSEHATADMPILKMTYNPMGLTDFFYFGLTMNTIKNYEFWYDKNSSPHIIEIRQLINWNDKSVEQFSASLDSIRISDKTGDDFKIEYLGPNMDHYDDPIINVPFKFYYSAWERQKQRMKDKDQRVIECYENGARAKPGFWINISNLIISRYSNNDVMPLTTGQWLVKENKLKFVFLTDIDNGGWYCSVAVEYTGNKK